jgi:hypothetical protein
MKIQSKESKFSLPPFHVNGVTIKEISNHSMVKFSDSTHGNRLLSPWVLIPLTHSQPINPTMSHSNISPAYMAKNKTGDIIHCKLSITYCRSMQGNKTKTSGQINNNSE